MPARIEAMKVSLRLFAGLHDLVGKKDIVMELPDGARVQDLKARLAALGDQLAKALQEKDQALSRGASWEGERARLLATLKEKDEVISMLNSTFQGLLKKTD